MLREKIVFGTVFLFCLALLPKAYADTAPTKEPAAAPTTAPASDRVTAKLNFTLSKRGYLSARVSMSKKPKQICAVRIYATISNTRGDGEGVSSRRQVTIKASRKRSTVFVASRLPPVQHVTDGVGANSVAQLNLQARITCGKTLITSTAAARYLDCGLSTQDEVTVGQFVEVLRRKIR